MTVVYVAPDGRDDRPGQSPRASADDGPLRTLHAAVGAARDGDGPGTIRLAPGEYFVEEPVVLTGRDAGLTIETTDDGPVTLIGGREISGWRRDEQDGDLWFADVPTAASGEWDFRLLSVDGRLCPRARLPEEGFFEHESVFDVPWMSTTAGGWKRKPTEKELTTLVYRDGDLGEWLDVRNAELTVYHMWDESMVGLTSLDPETRTVRFSNPAGHPPGGFNVHKYEVWNIREGLTRPGQWRLDRSAGRVVYRPLDGQDMTRIRALAATTETIIRIDGTEDAPVPDVTIRGLRLTVTNTTLMAGGFGALKFDGALTATHAPRCRIDGLEVFTVAGQGVKVFGDEAVVENCHVHDTGAGGVVCRGADALVRDNHVHDVGLTYPSGIGIRGGGKRLRVAHNTVHDTSYSAINAGGDDAVIEANHLYRAMKVLHDGAGIYTTFCERITLRGNFIHDIVDRGGFGASAYYLDEQIADSVIEGNVALRVGWVNHNHMARRNTVRGNVFVTDGDMKVTFLKCEDYTWTGNVCVAGGFLRFTCPESAEITGNVLHARKGLESGPHRAGSGEGESMAVPDGNVTGDPKVTVGEDGRVTFAPDGAAAALGIKPPDVTGAGCPGHTAADRVKQNR